MKKQTKKKIINAAVAIALAVAPPVAQTVAEKLMSDKTPAPQVIVIIRK